MLQDYAVNEWVDLLDKKNISVPDNVWDFAISNPLTFNWVTEEMSSDL